MSAHGHRKLTREDVTLPARHPWHKIPRIAAIVAAVGIVGSAGLGLTGDSHQFFFSYLVAFAYFLSLALGGLFFTLIHHATRAGWSVVVRRQAENIMGTLPYFAALFVPIVAGTHDLYHWTHTDDPAVAGDHILQHKAVYLNVPFMLARAVVYLGIWALLARWFRKLSLEQDVHGQIRLTQRMQRAAGPALVVFAFTLSYAAIDWFMSLDPHWFSTMFGVYYFAGSLIAIFSFMSLVFLGLLRTGTLRNIVATDHLHDLGKYLFAFTVFWSYIAFSQYMLIWYANIPEETIWFAKRSHGTWLNLGVTLCVAHFAIPFLFLMSRHIKRRKVTLAAGALWMLAVHYIDLYWVIMPVYHQDGANPHLLDVTTFLAVGGVFVWAYMRFLCRDALVPWRDPRVQESLKHEVIVA